VAIRHVAEESFAEMAAHAAKQALSGGGPPDLIINASAVPQQLVPDSSIFVQRALGLSGIPSFTVNATCLSFPVALYNAAALVDGGRYRRVLVVSAEIATRGRNFQEPESAALFGDGAAAAVLEPTPAGEASAILGFQMGTWPKGAELTEVRGGGTRQHPQDPSTQPADNLFHMDGPQIYKMARRRVPVVFRQLFDRCQVTTKDIDLVVPHQTSGRGVDAAMRYGFSESVVVKRVHEEGNCVAASIPLALAHAVEHGRLARGNLVLLCGTGAGLSVLALLLRW